MKRNYLWFVCFAVLAGAAVAFGADTKTADAGFLAGLNLQAILNGAIAGAVATFFGWFKNVDAKTGEREPFDLKCGSITVGIGAIIGAYCGWANKDLSAVATYIDTAPWVVAVELVLKGVLRNTPICLRSVVGYIKGGVTNPTPKDPAKP